MSAFGQWSGHAARSASRDRCNGAAAFLANREWLTSDQVRQLVDLLTLAAAADISDEDRYELDSCRSQVAQHMPAVEVLVLAGVLHETTDRPGPDAATRDDCRRWSAYLNHLLSAAAAAPAPTRRTEPILSAAAWPPGQARAPVSPCLSRSTRVRRIPRPTARRKAFTMRPVRIIAAVTLAALAAGSYLAVSTAHPSAAASTLP